MSRFLRDILDKQPGENRLQLVRGIPLADPTPPHPTPPQVNQDIKSELRSENLPISPVKDYTKVANSITRDAVPQGLFKGTSKHTYDALYLKTRGAIVPQRSIKLRKAELLKLVKITENTLQKHLFHLREVGLVVINYELGDNSGSVYEVLLPEEISQQSNNPTPPHPTPPQGPIPTPPQKLGTPPPHNLGWGGVGKTIENKDSYVASKTLIKTKEEKFDDEPAATSAFFELNKLLSEASRKITGRETTKADQEKWKHVAEILVAQLEIISSRTPISNAPAILAEHLHRLLNSRRAQEQIGLITPAEAKTAKEKKSKETPLDLHLCPDCFGTSFWNPDGKGRRQGCPHQKLEQARAEAAKNKEI